MEGAERRKTEAAPAGGAHVERLAENTAGYARAEAEGGSLCRPACR